MTASYRLTTALLVLLSVFLLFQRTGGTGYTAELQTKIWVETVLETVVIPSHKIFAAAASETANAVVELCAEPGSETLEIARYRFAKLVAAWSNVELYRFGPARINNLHDRLFFWPDRRGRGLRQVKRLMATKDMSAIDVTDLKQKSVATQGLPAFEYLLFGNGSEILVQAADDYHCRYTQAVARAINDHAAALLEGWTASEGHAKVMTAAGPGNSVYQTPDEAVHELLRAATAQLEILRELKLISMLGKTLANTKPHRAPFSRSELALSAMVGNIDAVLSLFANSGAPVLPTAVQEGYATSLRFELDQVRSVLLKLDADPRGWQDLLEVTRAQEKLRYAIHPLAGAIRILQRDYASALGLILGFNAMDGD